jgi:hypothetical protein
MAEYDRFAAPMGPGAQWPDGSPVSNWSQAVAVYARHGVVSSRGEAQHRSQHPESAAQIETDAALVLVRA